MALFIMKTKKNYNFYIEVMVELLFLVNFFKNHFFLLGRIQMIRSVSSIDLIDLFHSIVNCLRQFSSIGCSMPATALRKLRTNKQYYSNSFLMPLEIAKLKQLKSIFNNARNDVVIFKLVMDILIRFGSSGAHINY